MTVQLFDPGSVAVVTGGSRGIGAAVVRSLASEGADVLFTYRESDRPAKTIVDEVEAAGGRAEACQLDVSSETQVREFFRYVRRRGTGLDIFVNNAGITRDGLLATMSAAHFSRVLEVNVLGAFLCCREAFRLMAQKRSGSIVVVSSALAHQGGYGQTNYCASKGALLSFTRALALEARGYGIRVNSVSPGFVETDMTRSLPRANISPVVPLGRLATAAEIASAIVIVASGRLSYMTGSDIIIDGGLTAAGTRGIPQRNSLPAQPEEVEKNT